MLADTVLKLAQGLYLFLRKRHVKAIEDSSVAIIIFIISYQSEQSVLLTAIRMLDIQQKACTNVGKGLDMVESHKVHSTDICCCLQICSRNVRKELQFIFLQV